MTAYQYSISLDTGGSLNSWSLTKQISANVSIGQSASYIEGSGDLFSIYFASPLTESQHLALDSTVSAHNGATTTEVLANYLDESVFPFVKNLVNEFAAVNISSGITAAGKSANVLGIFEKQYPVGSGNPVSLKASFDTGSLYVSREIIQYVRDNPSEFTGLSPFVTDAKLLKMKNDIETFLGLPLST